MDDLLGIWGEPVVTGKPAGNDLRERKRSISVLPRSCPSPMSRRRRPTSWLDLAIFVMDREF